MNKSFKFRLYPNAEQRILLAKTFGCVRFIYNRMLSDKMAHYEATGDYLRTRPAQYKDEFSWLHEVDSIALEKAQQHLENAYTNFFRDKSKGFPKFKAKHSRRDSYTTRLVNGNIVLADGFLKLPKLEKVKVKQHRQIPSGYRLKSVTVSLTPSGKYYASILYEYDAEIRPTKPVNILGMVFSMQEVYADSNGDIPEYPCPYRQAQLKLVREQRKLSRRKIDGKNREKQRQKFARLHEHIANQRKDFLHKQSRRIANDYDAICIEGLNMRGISQALNSGKSMSNNGWYMFKGLLGYKLADEGKLLVVIDKRFPSRKLCHMCGYVNDNLDPSNKTWICESCGTLHHRDINAAINIRDEAIRRLA